MDIVFAAIGGSNLEIGSLGEALAVLGRRPDFEEVPVSDSNFAIRVRLPETGEGAPWCLVELQGEEALGMLVDTTHAIAAHLHKPVRAVATGIERESNAAPAKMGYRAYEIFPDGTKRTLSIPEADGACTALGDAPDGVAQGTGSTPPAVFSQLLSIVADAPIPTACDASRAVPADPLGRCFRRRVVLDDPRLARLAATIIAAKTVWFAQDPSGRVRLKIDATDGGKQISFVSNEEAVTLQRATKRSWIALERA